MAALVFIGFLSVVAIFADFLASDRPIYAEYNSTSHWPLFTPTKIDSIYSPVKGEFEQFIYNRTDWRKLELTYAVWPLIPYGPTTFDLDSKEAVSPWEEQYYLNAQGKEGLLKGRFRHLLGTTENGQDLLAGLIHGTRVSLLVGIISMGIAALIGILLGSMAGFYGDFRLQIPLGRLILWLPAIFLAYFYGFYVRRFALVEAGATSFGLLLWESFISLVIVSGIIFLIDRLGNRLKKVASLGKLQTVPVDNIISRSMEVLNSVPVILVVVSLSVIFKGNIWLVMVIIGLTNWTGIARLIRVELLRIVNLSYMESARAMGFSEWRQIWRHALPNGIAPVLVVISFGVASAILTESALSFLNIGVSEDTVTWGRLLNAARGDFDFWWLAVFPGVAIFLTVLSFNLIGEKLRDILDPRLARKKNR